MITKAHEMAHHFGSSRLTMSNTVTLTEAETRELWQDEAVQVMEILKEWGCSVQSCWVRTGLLNLKKVKGYQIRMNDPRFWY